MERTSPRIIKFGTRTSRLARWQTEHVLQVLTQAAPHVGCEVVEFVTTGDRLLDRPLPEIGGKGVFTAELENALRGAEIDLAVHSLKDLPIDDAPGLCVAAVSRRGDVRDVLVSAEGWTLNDLPDGARVGTSSVRRAAQLLNARPDLTILPLRGNVDTRIRKALHKEYDAAVLAAAGVVRLGLQQHITQYLPLEIMLPAPGQAAIALQCRAEDVELRSLLAKINHLPTYAAVTAERAFLAALGGGCSLPIAAYAQSDGTTIEMTALVAGADGQRCLRVRGSGGDPIALGRELVQRALDMGAGDLLR